MQKDPVVVVSVSRTAQGKFLGVFKNTPAIVLGAAVISDVIQKAHLDPMLIDEVLMGCVLTAGQGQAPARQAALFAHLPHKVACTTLNKMCASGMKAVMCGTDSLLSENAEIIIAGGMENMTRAPYLIPKAREGYRLGQGELWDHLMVDGLEDAYDRGKPMGYFAEMTAKEYSFDRETQDQYAKISLERAQKALAEDFFSSEITPITIETKTGPSLIAKDEHPLSVNINNIPKLKPAFLKEGTITPANASSIADGAAALLLMRLSKAKELNLTPLAKIVGSANFAKAPSEFTTAPIGAINQLLKKINWRKEDVDLFEINEAFAVVTLAAMKELGLSHERLNIHGGAIALGHPIGASGARILVTLISALKKYQLKRGIAALCIGGGEATAIAIETF